MGRLAGKVALISYAARGQGAAQARLFVKEGAHVVIGDVDDGHGEALATELGDAARFHRLDVGDPAAWRAATNLCETLFGRLDILVNGSGMNFTAPIADTEVADFERVVRVNQLGPLLGMQAAIEPMKRAGGGSIVNLISSSVISAFATKAIYGGSKQALRGMTGIAARELGEYRIRVNSVLPGAVATDSNMAPGQTLESLDSDYAGLPMARIGRAIDVANAVLFLASDEAAYCTGAELVVDGGMTAAPLQPPLSGRMLGRKTKAAA